MSASTPADTQEQTIWIEDPTVPLPIAESEMEQLLCGRSENLGAPGAGTDVDRVLNERGSRYGKFVDHAAVTQSLKSVMYHQDNWERLGDDQKEALEMICHKMGRILNGDPNYADSWVDIAGYAKLVSDRLEGTER